MTSHQPQWHDESRLVDPIDGLPVSPKPPEEKPGHHSLFFKISLSLAILLGVVLLIFAIDLLIILLLVVLVGLALHYATAWLADTELLSPRWLLIIVLAAGSLMWIAAPRSSWQSGIDITRYLPGPVARFILGAERQGLTHRVLVGAVAYGAGDGLVAGNATGSADAVGPAGASSEPADIVLPVRPASPVSVQSDLRIRLTAASGESTADQPMTLTATVERLPGRGRVGGVVEFLDTDRVVGLAALADVAGETRAELTLVGVTAGQHRFTARMVGRPDTTSAVLLHTVRAR